ncbi:hypothetical protein [Pseudoroseicyclus tamaricis]|uniref:Uncharacterized protein n=1 Tax=Pseudoroseicyclus tamaricis TaxID=2705421 RepID=A0A6B2JPV8_9RHOB|nr:hypothetical protein [Pseudoroseicyclus tamaricis]NDV00148.1 hypothetical protein [Pseudoroseicyclus tamaricis]
MADETAPGGAPRPFNILIVAQAGRLQYEALLFAASLRAMSPRWNGRLIVAEPERGGLWRSETAIAPDVRAELERLGAEVRPFTARLFGERYPQGNKIEALALLPGGEPFLFFDSDTLVTGELADLAADFSRPTASMRRTGTWPVEELYWPGYTAIWRSLYDRFGLEFEGSLDLSQPDEHWERYLYFNAGWFLGPDPAEFHRRFASWAVAVRDAPPEELAIQPLDPWLDQVVLPLVIHSLGGGRPGPELAGLDGNLTCHYRLFPLLYARESDQVVQVLEEVAAPNRIKKLLKQHAPIHRMVFRGQGADVRAMFDRQALPKDEAEIRKAIREAGHWVR